MEKMFAASAVVTTSGRVRRTRPNDEAIETLLSLTRSAAILEQVYCSLEQSVRASVNDMLDEQALSPSQRRAMAGVPAKVIAALRAECNWDLLRPQLVELYRESFDRAEIEGLIQFYRSAPGRAYLNKMPAVTQRSLALARSQVSRLVPKMELAVNTALREAKLARSLTVVPPRISAGNTVRRKAQR